MEFVYKNLQAVYEHLPVTEEQIDAQILRLRQQNQRVVNVIDRPAQNGDEVVLDYAGFVGEEQFEGGTAERQTLVLGSGMFIPGFEEQLIGANIGDTRDVTVRFPDDYRAENLAGKDAVFHCKIHEIRQKEAYTDDNQFAREVGQCSDYDELRARVKQSLQAYYDDRAEMELQDSLMRQAAATLDFKPTEQELHEAVDAQIGIMQAQLAQRGLSLEAYCQFTGASMDSLREDVKSEAENSLRVRKAAERIAILEGLAVTDADLAAEYQFICQQNGIDMQQLQAFMNKEMEDAAKLNALMRKAIAFVRAHAKITHREAVPNKPAE